jgi:predicted neutral ceramidase superfamily lipid hydrolase
MKYESEFRIKEKEFYPREKHSHKKVIDELANIVKRADLEIDELEISREVAFELHQTRFKELLEAHSEIRTYQAISTILALGVILLGLIVLV